MNIDFSLIPTITLAVIMLALGMELGVDDFRRVAKTPRAALTGIGAQLLLLPGVALLLAVSLPLSQATAMGLVLLASCPGGAVSNMFSRYASGDVALSISLTAVSSTAAPLTVPLVVGTGLLLVGEADVALRVPFMDMITTLVMTTATPVVAGMAIHNFAPRVAARWRGKLLAAGASVMVLLIVGLAVNTGRVQPDIVGMFTRSTLAVVVLMLVCATCIWLLSGAMGCDLRQRRTLVVEVGVQNINLALVVALGLLGKPEYLGPTIVYLPYMLLFGCAMVIWGRHARQS